MEKKLECIVHGRVQKVMFRDFVQRNARKLGLAGTVENVSDGTVRVCAEGDEKKLKQLHALISKGPTFARVDSVEQVWGEPTGLIRPFTINYKNVWDRI